MRYMYMIHADPSQPPPPAALMEKLHAMAERERQAGRMLLDGGLTPPSAGARIEVRDRKLKVMDGPFAESKEAVLGFAIFEYATRDEALKAAVDFMEVHRLHGEGWQGTCEMREIFTRPPAGCEA